MVAKKLNNEKGKEMLVIPLSKAKYLNHKETIKRQLPLILTIDNNGCEQFIGTIVYIELCVYPVRIGPITIRINYFITVNSFTIVIINVLN